MNTRLISWTICLFSFCFACQPESPSSEKTPQRPAPLFEKLPAERTGVRFNNELDPNEVKSPMEYVNVYNGGGVSAGDVNGDGLPDLYFTGNLSDNRLYLNQGDFRFEDVTERAGVAASGSWCTGTTMADVNKDGFLDLYVCRAYHDDPELRRNLLFVNNGDGTFSEKGKDYGVADTGYSIVATFLDYDKDGDEDLFVGNHPLKRNILTYAEHLENWKSPRHETSDHLYRNNGDGTFTDVTREAGVLNYGWTLGVVTADFNRDGWPDLFVSVDHMEPDRFYENNGDGTFSEVSEKRMKHLSYSSMGVDAGDINNDGWLDLAVVEMLSTNNFNEKTKMASMNPERFWYMVEVGYEYQYMRNMLHLNNGNGYFSEIGQMAGIHRTNWSWAALLADFDNDGWNDFYVTNGYLREYLDKDYHKKFFEAIKTGSKAGQSREDLLASFGKSAPTTRVPNNFFRNNGADGKPLTFTEKGPDYGLDNYDYSSGAAYADLDGDGDLDIVVNHSNNLASVYKNRDREQNNHHYLRVRLKTPPTVSPIGTKVTIETPSGIQFREFAYTRGYQSSVEGVLHFGLGESAQIDRLLVEWLDGKSQVLTNVPADQVLVLDYNEATANGGGGQVLPDPLFEDVTAASGVDFVHRETLFDDYKKQVLLPHKMSQFGPFFATGDINQDGLEDFFVGGGNGQAGTVFYQQKEGTFRRATDPLFEADKNAEDMGAAFLDVNNDRFTDLYVVSGGNEFEEGSPQFQDRLYINVGKGVVRKVKNALPAETISGSCVKPFDFDGDGDLDLFVGGRQVPGKYPSPANSLLLENVKGRFVDATASKAPGLQGLGMVTDAIWTDLNADGQADLFIVGEWMPLTVFLQKDGRFENATTSFGFDQYTGWWNRIEQADLDNDGDMDYVVGNLGWNYKYKASDEKPFHVFAGDFDQSGTFDIALG
ncbi:MAG: hypothetical protein D6714_21560, partial [Bacteroidetes bacterium]